MAMIKRVTLIGKSKHRDGGYDLTFRGPMGEMKIHATDAEAVQFMNTVIQTKDGVKHAPNLTDYTLVINPAASQEAQLEKDLETANAELAKTKAELEALKNPPVKPSGE